MLKPSNLMLLRLNQYLLVKWEKKEKEICSRLPELPNENKNSDTSGFNERGCSFLQFRYLGLLRIVSVFTVL